MKKKVVMATKKPKMVVKVSMKAKTPVMAKKKVATATKKGGKCKTCGQSC